ISRSWVSLAAPCVMAAMPPITTKSTPWRDSTSRSAVGRNSAQVAIRPLRRTGQLAHVVVSGLEGGQALCGRQPQVARDECFVDSRPPLGCGDLEPVTGRKKGTLQR